MDLFPEEVIGHILSCLGSARNVANASTTCHKWHKAAMHHLRKLTFIDSDIPSQRGKESGVREIIITEAIMKRSSLYELAISAENYDFQAAPVIAWISHTEKTLKSLTFMNRIKPNVNLLEKLGSVHSKLEKLEWRHIWITAINPTLPCFRNLVSLSLEDSYELSVSNMEALLNLCPKIEYLSLVDVRLMTPDGDGGMALRETIELKSSSLKILCIRRGFSGISNVVLHASSLETLRFSRLFLKQFTLVQGRGNSTLQDVSILESNIAQVDLGEAVDSLRELKLECSSLVDKWEKYHPAVRSATNLRCLHLRGWPDSNGSIDLSKVALTFPRLFSLLVTYTHVSKAFTSQGSSAMLRLEKLTYFSLYTEPSDGLSEWIARFLECCPNLQCLRVCIGVTKVDFNDSAGFLGSFYSSMIGTMRPHPNITVKFDFLV